MALTSLMLEKSVGDITVREITELADVNRGTFYTHYSDVNDLLKQLEDNIFIRLEEIGLACNPNDSNGDTFHYLSEILTLVGENSDIFKALICRNGDIDFHKKLFDALKDQYLREFLMIYYPSDRKTIEYYCSFIVSGMLSITQDWILGGQNESPQEIARMGGDFIMRGIRALK
jgi:AcrR family transcriptional regulator